MDSISISFNMKVVCVFSLEAILMTIDSNEYTQYTTFNNKKHKNKSASMGVLSRDSKTSSNSRGKGAISVRAIEGLLCFTYIRKMGG